MTSIEQKAKSTLGKVWFNELVKEAMQQAELLLKVYSNSGESDAVLKLLNDDRLCQFLGSTEVSIPVPYSSNIVARCYYKLWARRCYTFFLQFSKGLELASQSPWLNEDNNQISNAIQDVNDILTTLSTISSRVLSYPGWKVKKHLGEKREISNFNVTNIDAKLRTALYLLENYKVEIHGDVLDSNIHEYLLSLIKEEVEYYSDYGKSISDAIGDASNLWWGLQALIDKERADFKIGEFEGYGGAAEVCMNLILAGELPYTKDENMILKETNPEIIGQVKTTLWTIVSCVRILKTIPHESFGESGESLEGMKKYVRNLFLWCRNRSSAQKNPYSHAYLMGTALEVCWYYLDTSLGSNGEFFEELSTAQGGEISSHQGLIGYLASKYGIDIDVDYLGENLVYVEGRYGDEPYDSHPYRYEDVRKVLKSAKGKIDVIVDEKMRRVPTANPNLIKFGDIGYSNETSLLWLFLMCSIQGKDLVHKEIGYLFDIESNLGPKILRERIRPYISRLRNVIGLRGKYIVKRAKNNGERNQLAEDGWSFCWIRVTPDYVSSELFEESDYKKRAMKLFQNQSNPLENQ